MLKKRWMMIVCSAILVVCLSGCQALHDLAVEMAATVGEDSVSSDSVDTEEGAAATSAADDPADIIPLDVVMGFIEYETPQISSDGSMVLYRHSNDDEDVVIAENWQTGEKMIVSWPNIAGIPYYYWAPDGETVLFFVDSYGDENFGLYTSNIYTGETSVIIPGGDNDCYYVSDNPNNENEIFIAFFNDISERFDLYLINYETGVEELVMENPGEVTGYGFDHDGNLRIAVTTDEEAGSHVWLKKDAGNDNTSFVSSEWKEILSWDYEDVDTSGVVGFMPDDERILYYDSSLGDTSTLCTYDVDSGEIVEIYNDPDYEIYHTWTDLELNEVTAVTVYSQMIEWVILDESFRDDYEALFSVGDVFEIVGSSEEDEYWLVSYISDTQQPDYYIYDMETHELEFLYNADPELEEYEFASMEPFSYTASDGLKIEGYVTFPVGIGREDLPTVVLVHGGPTARDTWGYNSEAQFLANRGYVVIQVNFRGSTGYGKEFIHAGDKEWGGMMHQDILDAVDYVVDQGWTDPDRVGVYGASYGGYEALICAAFSSDIFTCAVDAFGPSSLLTLIESMPAQWSVSYQDLIRSVGDPETEEAFMKERSPLYYAEDMEIPLLIVQGENDVRVTQQESDQMVEALEAAGIPVDYILLENTGHGFSSVESSMAFYSAMEEFFAKYLGGETG
ncbi:MAG: S9 family peptidase [Eubacteriales bacterium]|nr:S9 family peptidase [Eubacteriales bacterium]